MQLTNLQCTKKLSRVKQRISSKPRAPQQSSKRTSVFNQVTPHLTKGGSTASQIFNHKLNTVTCLHIKPHLATFLAGFLPSEHRYQSQLCKNDDSLHTSICTSSSWLPTNSNESDSPNSLVGSYHGIQLLYIYLSMSNSLGLSLSLSLFFQLNRTKWAGKPFSLHRTVSCVGCQIF